MTERMLASSEHSQQTASLVAVASADTTGVIAVKLSGCLVHYTPAAARWLSDTGSLVLGDAWYAGLAEPVRSRMQCEWMMNRLDGAATSDHQTSARTFCFENGDSTRQVVVEFAIPVGDAAQAGLVIGTVRVSHLEPGSWAVRNGSAGGDLVGDEAISSESPDMRSKLLRKIGHEMQQPIYAIQNFMFAARQHLKMGQAEQVGEMLSKIERQIVRAREFGDRLRQFATQSRQNVRPTDLHQVIDACGEMVQIYADDARAAVQFNLLATETMVACDPVQIHHVLLNLVRNATDSLVSADSPDRSLGIETDNEAETIYLRVVDSGPGVTDGDQERIFQLFFTTKEPGLGMGLPFYRSVISAHGGKLLLAENRPGRVVFEIQLPIIV